jgi:hypothetical protein
MTLRSFQRHYPERDNVMKIKKFFTALALCLVVSGSSFGANHVVTKSAKVAGKGAYKVTKYTVKGTGKTLKFLF